jgi:hypothetical protein
MSITIDSTEYAIPIVSLKRKGDFLYKFAQRTNDGNLQAEMIGVYFNYQLKLGTPRTLDDVAAYALLWDKLTEPVIFHTVTVPDETLTPFTYTAYFSTVSDELMKKTDAANFWKNLTVNFIARAPTRTP